MSEDEQQSAGPNSDSKEKKVVLVHKSWQFQVIEANREGNIDKLCEAYESTENPAETINLTTRQGGYGGFRYNSWGVSYGGNPDGESILHIVVRPDNSLYPNRYEMAKRILELGADVTIRSARDCTPRDLNKKLMDAVFPLSEWGTLHTLAWLQSRGKSLAFQDKWLLLFEMKGINGRSLVQLSDRAVFDKWVLDQLSHLTKLGLPTEDLDREMHVLSRILK